MKTVKISQRVEDSNEFAIGTDGTDPIPEVTIGHRVGKFSVVRVDKFPAGWQGALPDGQADALIKLGYATAV